MHWYRKHYFETDTFTLNDEPKTFKLTTSCGYKENSKLNLKKHSKQHNHTARFCTHEY